MTAQPSSALSCYRRSARALGAKSALAGTAAAAATLLASSASAQPVAYQATTENVVSRDDQRILYISFDTNTVTHTHLNESYRAAEVRVLIGGSPQSDHFTSFILAYGVAIDLAHPSQHIANNINASQPIPGSLFSGTNYGYFNTYSSTVQPAWAGVVDGFIGVKVMNIDGFHYGWIQLSTNADASQLTVTAFGYNRTAGASVLAGEGASSTPVPEPATSAALLALGAAGLVAYRRRKHLHRAAA